MASNQKCHAWIRQTHTHKKQEKTKAFCQRERSKDRDIDMVSLKLQKRLASSVLKCGRGKVQLDPNEVNEISMANSLSLSLSLCFLFSVHFLFYMVLILYAILCYDVIDLILLCLLSSDLFSCRETVGKYQKWNGLVTVFMGLFLGLI